MDRFTAYFGDWLDNSFVDGEPSDVVAYSFNLGELDPTSDQESKFCIELIGAAAFDEHNSDWACDEVFESTPRSIPIPNGVSGLCWEECLDKMTNVAANYLESGSTGSMIMDRARAVGIGFIDGDLHLIKSSN